jgi:hypothetical protein
VGVASCNMLLSYKRVTRSIKFYYYIYVFESYKRYNSSLVIYSKFRYGVDEVAINKAVVSASMALPEEIMMSY